MSHKKTQKEIEEILRDNFNNEFILLSNYINMTSKSKFKHNLHECNHEWECEPRSIINMKQGCPKCKGKNNAKKFSLNYDYIKLQIESENGYKLLSKEYANAKTKLLIICPKKHIFIKDWNNWNSKKSRCPICQKLESSENQKYPVFNLLKDLKDDKLEVVEWLDKYKNRNSRFILKCENDHVIQRTVGAYLNNKSRRGAICPQCSYDKFGASISGDKNYLWKGGVTAIRNHFHKQILSWRKESMKHHNYKCVLTGSKNFEIHHLRSFNKIIEEVFELSKLPIYQKIGDYTQDELNTLDSHLLNLHSKYGYGVCLDSDIHKEFHRIYGYGNNTPEQFEEFKINNIYE
jgi:hypothetical protein